MYQWSHDEEYDVPEYSSQQELDLIMDENVYKYLLEQHRSK